MLACKSNNTNKSNNANFVNNSVNRFRMFYIFSLVMALTLILSSFAYAQIDIFVNSYDASKNRALIQIQNSGQEDLHDAYYIVNDQPKQSLAKIFAKGSSGLVISSLQLGYHTIKVETQEGITAEKKILLADSEVQSLQEAQKPLTATQIQAKYNPDEKTAALIETASVDQEEYQKNALVQIKAKNQQENKIALQQTALDSSKDVLSNQNIHLDSDQKKEFPANKKQEDYSLVILILILLVFAFIIISYFYKKRKNK